MHSLFFFFFFFSSFVSFNPLEESSFSNFYNILSCRLQICLQFAGLNNASYVYIYNIFALFFFINSLLHETIKPFFPRYVLCLDFRRVFAHLLRLYSSFMLKYHSFFVISLRWSRNDTVSFRRAQYTPLMVVNAVLRKFC